MGSHHGLYHGVYTGISTGIKHRHYPAPHQIQAPTGRRKKAEKIFPKNFARPLDKKPVVWYNVNMMDENTPINRADGTTLSIRPFNSAAEAINAAEWDAAFLAKSQSPQDLELVARYLSHLANALSRRAAEKRLAEFKAGALSQPRHAARQKKPEAALSLRDILEAL